MSNLQDKIALIVYLVGVAVATTTATELTEFGTCKDKFLYFAYGSNLLTERIHINNPSAEFFGIGYIQDYRLDFVTRSNLWKGAPATIVETPGAEVWGALWTLDCRHVESLDRQEGVHMNWYIPRYVPVITPTGEVLLARTYQQRVSPNDQSSRDIMPISRRPSLTYLKVILNGALQCGLPKPYVMHLFSIPHNGAEADIRILSELPSLNSTILYPDHYSSVSSSLTTKSRISSS